MTFIPQDNVPATTGTKNVACPSALRRDDLALAPKGETGILCTHCPGSLSGPACSVVAHGVPHSQSTVAHKRAQLRRWLHEW